MTPRCRPLHQSQEVHFPHQYGGISWVYSVSRGITHGPSKSLDNPSMAGTPYHNVCKVQSFLGFANFYQHFISGYMEFTQPLTNLCQKNTPWHFEEPESTAFQHLKTAFHTAPVLYHWVLDLPMTVETDASDYAIAGILSVTTLDLEIHPIAFHS